MNRKYFDFADLSHKNFFNSQGYSLRIIQFFFPKRFWKFEESVIYREVEKLLYIYIFCIQ